MAFNQDKADDICIALGDGLKRGHLSEDVKEKMRVAAFKRPELFGAWSAI